MAATNTTVILGPFQLLKTAVNSILEDESFKIPSPLATSSVTAACDLLEWVEREENKQQGELFSNAVVAELERAFSCTAALQQKRREKMWGLYHSIRTSSSYISLWTELLQQCAIEPLPVFYQHVTDQIFHRLIENHFPILSPQASTTERTLLGNEQANAIRYVAGFVCHSLRKKITASSTPNKQELLLSLWELLEDETTHDSDDGNDVPQSTMPSSSDWVNAIDRGGLTLVTEQAYLVFCAIEEVVSAHLSLQNVRKIADGEKHELIKKLKRNEEVRFQWCVLAVDMSVEIAELLLNMVMEMWITIRGFSFAKCYMELYKQREKKLTQRSKGSFFRCTLNLNLTGILEGKNMGWWV